jgi:putative transposase
MIRLMLSDQERAAVRDLRRDRTLTPAERDRVEMVLLSAEGWSPPRIARHLSCHAKTVRLVLTRFAEQGANSLRRRRPGPAPDTARRTQVLTALNGLLDQDRTWTAAQLAAALGEQGIALSARQTRKYLKLVGAGWRRTARTLRHKQTLEQVAQATAELDTLKKGRPAERSDSSISTNAALVPASR